MPGRGDHRAHPASLPRLHGTTPAALRRLRSSGTSTREPRPPPVPPRPPARASCGPSRPYFEARLWLVKFQENLTSQSRQLLREAKEWARENRYKYAWHKNGKILLRKSDGDSVSFGFLHGVEESDGDLTNLKFTMRLVSTVPGREDHLVWLRLASSQPPDNVILFGLQLLVRQPSPRPLQCRPSGRIGQVSEICPRVGACVSCGHQHQAAAICRL
ncbi:hypothetical protein MRX96_057295 [Rhipicephalus microplus]